MEKSLVDMTFDELAKTCLEVELDAIVQGKSLKNRVYQTVELATRWEYEFLGKRNSTTKENSK